MGEVDNGGGCALWKLEVYGKSLYFSLDFAVDLERL